MNRIFIAITLVAASLVLGSAASAKRLGIPPVAQETPVWCWAASGEMVLRYYRFPNLNPAGDYQCGVVGVQGGSCWSNCGTCVFAGGTTQRIAAILRLYAVVARQFTGFNEHDFQPEHRGRLSPRRVMDSINDSAPIIAGITPQGIPFPSGAGFSQHAVVIVGYRGDEDDLDLIVNDPYPPNDELYRQVGATRLKAGQYQISYDAFVDDLNYRNSITFN